MVSTHRVSNPPNLDRILSNSTGSSTPAGQADQAGQASLGWESWQPHGVYPQGL
jgi:hypothetical protein